MTPTTLRLLQLNDVKLVGRLTRDPDVRYTSKGQAVARLDLAVNRRYKDGMGEWKDDTTFVSVTVWREAAERCRERLKKGSPVFVEGRLRSTSWETKEGQKRTGLEVEAQRVQFLAKSGDESGSSDDMPATESDGAASESAPDVPVSVPVAKNSDDIPF